MSIRNAPAVPMIATPSTLKDLVSTYLAGLMDLEGLDRAIASWAETSEDQDSEARDLYGELELDLGEMLAGHLSEDEFKSELMTIQASWPTIRVPVGGIATSTWSGSSPALTDLIRAVLRSPVARNSRAGAPA